MIVGINCLRTSTTYKGGVNSFTFGLLDGFAQSRRNHEFVVFASQQNREMFRPYESLPNFRVIEVHEASLKIVRGVFRRLPQWLRRLRHRIPALSRSEFLTADVAKFLSDEADIMFVPYCPPITFPFPKTPSVYSIHDLQHIHYPQFFTTDEILDRDATFKKCTDHAALIQASSEQMRDDFRANFPVLTPEKVVVIREGVDIEAFAKPVPNNDVRTRYGLPEQFMYFPAQLWYHKNHITVLKALVRLKERGINTPLVLSGARYAGSEHLFDFIAQHNIGDRVFYLGLVPSEDVVALHQAARFLITAVLYESSSIPILEAAAAGTAIIASHTPANEERAAELRLNLFTPTDDAELADLLAKIWPDDDLIATQVAYNKTAIQKFSWASVAADYLDAFETLYARHQP